MELARHCCHNPRLCGGLDRIGGAILAFSLRLCLVCRLRSVISGLLAAGNRRQDLCGRSRSVGVSLRTVQSMQFDTLIEGGTIVTAVDTYASDIGIADGRITAIAESLPRESARQVISAEARF